MIPKENYQALVRINDIQENEIKNLRKEIDELKGQIEILKKFSLLGDIFYEIRNLRNTR